MISTLSSSGIGSTGFGSTGSENSFGHSITILFFQNSFFFLHRNRQCDLLSCVADVDGFGVDGAEGVDVPDVDAVAEVHGV